MANKLTAELQKIYDELSTNNIDKAVAVMNSKEMREIFDAYFKKLDKDKEVDKDSLDLLEMMLRIANSIYNYSGESTGLSDSEYDELVEYYRNKTKNDDFITERLIKDDDIVNHKFTSLRGTLDKIYKLTDEDKLKNKSQHDINYWVKSTERRLKENYAFDVDLLEEEVYVMPKFDGVSCIFECDKDGNLQRALLRGDTTRNETTDVAHIVKGVFKSPIGKSKYEYGLKTEVMMTNENFRKYNETYNTNYKNSRSIVSSILNSDEPDERVDYLKIVPLRVSYWINNEESQQELPASVFDYPYIRCKLKELEKIHNWSFDHFITNDLRCDGSVLMLVNEDLRKMLGRENHKNKFEVAFKFTEEIGYSKVTDIIFQTGLFGNISPVVVFKPITLKGNKVSRASLGSFARYTDLGLAKGDVIKISYDIIPYVDFVSGDHNCVRSGNDKIEPPLVCPECGKPYVLSEDGTYYKCENKNCPCRQRGKILNYCRKMGIDLISEITIDELYRRDLLMSIEDLYSLEKKKRLITDIPGYGAKKVEAIINSINGKYEAYPSEIFGSIGIEGISKKIFANIFDVLDIDEVLEYSKAKNYEVFYMCKGIKEKSAVKLVDGINENRDLIKFLLNHFTVLVEPKRSQLFSVVFSKVRDDDLEQYIMNHGGNVTNSVSSKTSFVVVPMLGVTSNKIQKAEELGIPIIELKDAKEYIDQKL